MVHKIQLMKGIDVQKFVIIGTVVNITDKKSINTNDDHNIFLVSYC